MRAARSFGASAKPSTHATGGPGDDILFGDDAANTLAGGEGNDTLYGKRGDDTLFGNQDNDTLYGNQGRDTLYGGKGDDTLYGGQDADALFGNLGNDLLQGGLGADTLTGGDGADRFRYALAADSTAAAFDTITDFTSGVDRIDVSAVTATARNNTYSILQTSQQTVIDIDVGADGHDDMHIVLAGSVSLHAGDIVGFGAAAAAYDTPASQPVMPPVADFLIA